MGVSSQTEVGGAEAGRTEYRLVVENGTMPKSDSVLALKFPKNQTYYVVVDLSGVQ